MKAAALLVGVALSGTATAQEAGWHYSPLPEEGDRAAMGCGGEADASAFTCLVVRCEDDFSVGLHVHTSRADDVGRWRIDIDKDSHEVTTEAEDTAPYGGRIVGDIAVLLDGLKQGAVVYLDALEGEPVVRNGISLAGSLYAINQALYFCAPQNGAEETGGDRGLTAPVPAPQLTR